MPDSGGDGGGAVSGGGGTLVYAPYCPHSVNCDLVGDRLGALHRTAYLGTCFEYYEALGQMEAAGRRRRSAVAAAEGGGGDGGGRGSGGGRDGAACGCGLGGGGEGWEDGPGMLAELRRRGRALEFPIPRFGLIHGVTMRLHVFPREAGGPPV